MSQRRKYELFADPNVEVKHWYAMCVSGLFYQNWELRQYLPFRPAFALASKARAVVIYDRLINNEHVTKSQCDTLDTVL